MQYFVNQEAREPRRQPESCDCPVPLARRRVHVPEIGPDGQPTGKVIVFPAEVYNRIVSAFKS